MKKILLTLVAALVVTSASAFSFNWGITGGLNYTKVKISNSAISNLKSGDSQAGWNIGVRANVGLIAGFSVNGVARLHTEILKNQELKDFYEMYPEKFNNKTNGITFRRWLLHCNHKLADLITSLIGDGYKKDAMELEKLAAFFEDENVLKQILEIKSENKKALKEYLKG